MIAAWLDQFPPLAALDPVARDRLATDARALSLPAGSILFETGKPCRTYIILRSGRVRVHQLDDDGHEIVLYRLGPGDTCILTTAALFSGEPYAAFAVSETPVELVGLPVAAFDALVAGSDVFRRFVFASHAARLAALMRVVRDVAFRPIDARLSRRLLDLAGTADRLLITHARLAAELGTAREVISRRLKHFERSGWIGLAKGSVTLRDRDRLRAVSG
jgi:CRP/FNR family transcriptional regulator